MIFETVYKPTAVLLTNVENPWTWLEYEDNYTSKALVFEFVSFYTASVYIAFFKDKFLMYPDDDKMWTEGQGLDVIIFILPGCLSELSVQLSICLLWWENMKTAVIQHPAICTAEVKELLEHIWSVHPITTFS